MNRVRLFENWLREQGVDPKNNIMLDEAGLPGADDHGCLGFVCPEEKDKVNWVTYCENCEYNEFWTKEITDGTKDTNKSNPG